MRWLLLCLGGALHCAPPPAAALSPASFASPPRHRLHLRAPAPLLQLGEPVDVPSDLETVCAEAAATIREGLLRGVRGMRVDLGVPAVNIASPMFEPAALGRICLELARPLLLLDGKLLLLLPGVATCAAARALLEDARLEWPEAYRAQLQVAPLSLHGAPSGELPAAVMVVGLENSRDADDTAFRDGRQWLGLAGARCAVLCVNPDFRYAPTEMRDFDTMYAFFSYGVTSTKADDANQPVAPPRTAGRALLRRAAPGPWKLLFDAGDGTYRTLAETEDKPDEEAIRTAVAGVIKGLPQGGAAAGESESRDAAISSLESIFQMGGAEAGAPPQGVAEGGVPLEGGVSATTRALDWQTIQDTTTPLAMKLYQAEAILRVSQLGPLADFEDDSRAVHVLSDVADSQRGAPAEVGAACLLFAEGASGRLAQLAARQADKDVRARRVADLLQRATEEASRLGLERLEVEGEEAPEVVGWLKEAGFEEQSDGSSASLVKLL
ncbi:hypothetical protein AB1Y20_021081 [Prymnesium parvum]|uniref:DUF1995 domain-containing protein n=1 Tax=Prymnesium parvum TaxID=97485 RepID=A0AB34JKI4_PRYPA